MGLILGPSESSMLPTEQKKDTLHSVYDQTDVHHQTVNRFINDDDEDSNLMLHHIGHLLITQVCFASFQGFLISLVNALDVEQLPD